MSSEYTNSSHQAVSPFELEAAPPRLDLDGPPTTREGRHGQQVTSSLLRRIPEDAWDSHMHILDPVTYPLADDARYVPPTHLLGEALDFEAGFGISNVVLVQPSIYGNDNSCLLDALRALGPDHGRGVVAFDPATIDVRTLQEWHDIGVRGVRLNLQSIEKEVSEAEMDSMLHQYADIIRPFNWVLQLYVPLSTAPLLEKIVPELGVKVCLDHFGSPAMPKLPNGHLLDPYSLAGFSSLTRLLRHGRTYVKLSAAYRLCEDNGQIAPVARELLHICGGRKVVFATDWPHTRFQGLDIQPFVEKILELCGNNVELVKYVFRDNAQDLWGVRRRSSVKPAYRASWPYDLRTRPRARLINKYQMGNGVSFVSIPPFVSRCDGLPCFLPRSPCPYNSSS